MTAFNAVRFRVKAGREQEFLDAHKKSARDWPGLRYVNIIKTAERSYGRRTRINRFDGGRGRCSGFGA
jgi:hypothetical protein